MRTRNWSIRSKIITMVTVPLVALLALWIFATALTAGPALNLLAARTLANTVGNPGEVIIGELQRERRLTVQFLADPSASVGLLGQQRTATDRAISDFRTAAEGGDAWRDSSETLRHRIEQVFTEINTLPAQRRHVDRRELDPLGAQNLYNGMIQSGFDMFAATATFPDDEIDRRIRALSTVGRGQEYLSRVDSLLAAVTVTGQFTDELRMALVQDVGTARFLLAQGVEDMPEASRAQYQQIAAGDAFVQLNRMMDRLIVQSRSGQLSPVGADSWHPAYEKSGQQLRDFENDAIDTLADRASSLALTIILKLLLAALLGLIAFVVSVTVSVKVGRSMVGRLRRLRGEALEMATERLPNVVRRLQRGENVDVDVETPPLVYGKDEIGQLGHAFNDVQRTAVQSAVEEANVRRGLNEVFLNIARRSQTLLHRQLALLDRMERRETEPQELEDLYRVDHLATRMRRHAEDLVILAGAAPGRGWRNPVPVIDVVRGAISEVEDYKRIDIRSIESSAVLGRAVGDVIHLLAELLENATSYSPPHTRVQVSGQVLPNGYAIEIEDRGLGMTHDAIDEANRRLVEPPDFDPADSARLGLFVVAQLANRHGIRVSLRQSPYAGVTAIVLVPGELVVTGPGPAELPAGPDRPLVGSGSADPSRSSLAELQWQGTEQLRELTATGQPVTINGIVAHPEADLPRIPAQRESPEAVPGGPVPASVADGLSADGLVQRRRVRRPADLGETTKALPKPGAGRKRGIAPVTSAPPAQRRPAEAPPAQRRPAEAPPAQPKAEATEDGLPKRVRQANLAPQLRHPVEVEPDEPTVPLRSPEQIRSIMSALQLGTTRGRIEASKFVGDSSSEDRAKPEKEGNGGSPGGPSFADAATVSFPAIVNVAIANGEAAARRGNGAAGDRTENSEQDPVTRPEKDTK
ncbi:signal transduction histidine kinase [Actinoplanes tereljensis]|uniref:histidine kinase n=1 Tax=Paractinoplanes tereljensis TaxID=571912 RepID=A0A919NJP8_9ACTN|nr:nitrate- and nitrite sensing domain-containing protein [Actinoplanes tereljensis]GIF18942.1 histidine kinase [Actinoplanes tereljensis]